MCNDADQTSNVDSPLRNLKTVVGFDAKNKDALVLYICQICSFLLRIPCQLDCGHRCCQSCIEHEEGSLIKCSKCNEESPRDRIRPDRGCILDMEKLDVICSLCEWNGLFKDYQKHLDEIHINPFCEHCGKEFDSVNSLTQHMLICERITIDCVLKPYGCDEKYNRMNAGDHFLSEQHQNILLKFFCQNILHIKSGTDDEQTVSTNEIYNNNFEQLNESMDILLSATKTLSDDTQRLGSESLSYQNTLQSITEDMSKVKLALQETHALMDAHKSHQQTLEQDLALLQQQLHDQTNISHDGTLIWKIADFQQKLADAQSERQTSVYSPIFYSSPNGYKMRLRLYPMGDGNAKRTHISLFFVLLRGEFDPIISFPFSYKISFCLIDQTPQLRHIIDSFRPDTKSSSFQRPRSDMNIASGIPKFVPLTIIQQDNNPYVRDDTMFIKVMLNFVDVSKTLLPYTISLNPGFPAIIQHEYIKRESERQAPGKLPTTTQTSMPANLNTRSNGAENHIEDAA